MPEPLPDLVASLSAHDPARTVVFQGAPGAWSHLAALSAAPELQPVGLPTFEDAFDAVEAGLAAAAVVPVENAIAGRVADIHRLLPERTLHIVAEHFQPVDHQLLAPPGATLDTLRVVRSHPQALAQCRRTLRALGLRPEVAADTARAAAEVADAADPSVGALASPLAAARYGLQVIQPRASDLHGNTTRFVVLATAPRTPPPEVATITSCLFTLRNVPAALYKALGGFATNGVNLVRLESHQLDGFAWTQFSVDFEGRPEDTSIHLALEELAFFSERWRILGCYPAAPDRGDHAGRASLHSCHAP